MLLAGYAEERDDRQGRVIAQPAEMGKTSYLLALLESNSNRSLRKKFLQNFGRNGNPQIRAWVKRLASQESDLELRALARASVEVTGQLREG